MSSFFDKKNLTRRFKYYGFYPLLPILIPIFIGLIILNKIIHLKIALADNGRIGGIFPLYWYLSSRETLYPNQTLIICYSPSTGKSSNSQWDKMFKRKITILEYPTIFDYVQRMIRLFKGLGSQLIFVLPKTVFHNENILLPLLNQNSPCLWLTEEECEKGEMLLEKQGIAKTDQVICFHNRDSAYLNMTNPDQNWSYHDYRDSSVQHYIKTAEYFAQKGYHSIRIGSVALEKVKSQNPRVIDYAFSDWKSDFMDIYLSYRCSFLLCSDTGISAVAEILHRPLVYVNWTLLPRMTNWVHFAVFIPKKIFSKKLNRLLTFQENITNPDFVSPHRNIKWDEFELYENTSDEIYEACLEMEQRLNHLWVETEEDVKLQSKFWSIYPPSYVRPKKLYIGSKYLRDNPHLLKVIK